MNDGFSCRKVGKFYYYGVGVIKDKEKSREYYRHACELGDAKACKFDGVGVGFVYIIPLIFIMLLFILYFAYAIFRSWCITKKLKLKDPNDKEDAIISCFYNRE